MTILINKTGFYSKEWVYDEQAGEGSFVITPCQPGCSLCILKYWNADLELDEITLQELIVLLRQNGQTTIKFLEHLTDCNITPFLHEIDESYEKQPDDCSIEYIRVGLVVETIKYRERGQVNNKAELTIFPFADGKGKPTKESVDTYGLEFSHWGSLKDLPIKIQNTVDLCQIDESVLNEPSIIPCNYVLSMGEFFTGLFNELCFCGSPDIRDGRLERLKEQIKEIEDGTAKLIPIEDLWDKFDEDGLTKEEADVHEGTG
jgi:hypothetical protein